MHIYPPFTPPQFWRFGLFRINRQGKRRRNVFLDFLPKNGIILIYKLVIQIGFEADFPSLTEEIAGAAATPKALSGPEFTTYSTLSTTYENTCVCPKEGLRSS